MFKKSGVGKTIPNPGSGSSDVAKRDLAVFPRIPFNRPYSGYPLFVKSGVCCARFPSAERYQTH